MLSLMVGTTSMPPMTALSALFGQGETAHILIVQELRLPRTLLAGFIGAGLGASGAALQGYTRNALAAPGILGFSACASLGAVLALYFGLSAWVPVTALLGAGSGAGLILALTGVRKGAATLILAGVGVGALATALTGLLMNFAPNPWALSEIVYWMMGSLRNADMHAFYVCAPLTALGLACLIFIGPDLKTLSLGETTAESLGVSLTHVQILLIAGVALTVGSGVAVAGSIGFVGLFIPHILRMAFGADPARLIGWSALGGAVFLILADTLTRLMSGPGTPLYLGILTSLIGVPFFLWLAVREVKT
jgi:iron complex transport system permease protein